MPGVWMHPTKAYHFRSQAQQDKPHRPPPLRVETVNKKGSWRICSKGLQLSIK